MAFHRRGFLNSLLTSYISAIEESSKQLLDKVFVISRVIKVEDGGYQPKPKAQADNPCRYHLSLLWAIV